MIHKAECFRQALQQVQTHRHIAIEQADARRNALLSSNHEFAALEQALIKLSQKKMMAKIQNNDSLPALEQEYYAMLEHRSQLLQSSGLSDEALLPAFACVLCQDTGITDGKTCQCVQKLANQKMLEQLCEDLPAETFSFDTFSLDYYSSVQDKKQMQQVFTICQDYVRTFSLAADSLYMLGNTGLGKTHLTFSMAKEIVTNGFSVIYCTAQSMITALEKEHFGQTNQPVSEWYQNTELLILDDLGTEFLSAVAQAALYTVINHRILMHFPTIINSNLSPKELETRYGERLASRIFGCYRTLRFVGKDIRIQKRLASKKF